MHIYGYIDIRKFIYIDISNILFFPALNYASSSISNLFLLRFCNIGATVVFDMYTLKILDYLDKKTSTKGYFENILTMKNNV